MGHWNLSENGGEQPGRIRIYSAQIYLLGCFLFTKPDRSRGTDFEVRVKMEKDFGA